MTPENRSRIFIIRLIVFCFIGIVSSAPTSSSTSDNPDTAPTNMIVDFDSTSLDSNLRPGDSGILNLVVENTGGMRAENVEIWLSSTALAQTSKNFYIGRIDAGKSETISVIIRIDDKAKTGLNAIKVNIEYDGFYADGHNDYNQHTTWEIPLTIYGDPLFQITPLKTTYFKDNLGELNLTGLTMDSVKDLEATLSSTCATVIGSSRKYVGDIDSNKTFKIVYPIKPSSPGACVASLTLSYTDESGTRVSDNLSIGLNVEEAGVDFKIVGISYEPTGPGQTMSLNLSVKNVDSANAEDVTLSLSLTDPFTTAETSEKYVGAVGGGETVNEGFKLAVSWDAETKVYSIPLVVSYKVGGTSYSVEKNIGVDVGGQVILEIINVESSRGSIRVEVANIGTRTADGVKATLVTGGEGMPQAPEGIKAMTKELDLPADASREDIRAAIEKKMNAEGVGGQDIPTGKGFPGNRSKSLSGVEETQYLVSYKSNIKPNMQTTFTFNTMVSGMSTLILEYTGPNNKRVTQREKITLTSKSVSGDVFANKKTGGTDIATYAFYGLAALIVVFVAYQLYRSRKSR